MEASKTVKDHLVDLYEHVSYYNEMAPFPIYDTDYVKLLKKTIDEMVDNNKEYNELPVYYCKHCKSLHIEVDESNNDICHRCGSVNEIDSLPNIEAYNLKYGKIWE